MDETLKVLVVDDDEVDRMTVRRALKSADLKLELSEAWDYETAIAAVQAKPFDCVILDYRLPDKDGLELVHALRGQGLKIPLLVMTGQGDEQIAVDLMKAGASDYLSKSRLSTEVLERILRNAWRVYQAEMQAQLAIQQREQLIRQREDFMSRLTHDLRTPLVAADRMLALFHQNAFGDLSTEMQEAIAIMIRSNQNLLQMVNTMLEVYRHDAGQKEMKFLPCNMSTIVQEVVQELKPLADDKSLALTLILADDPAPPTDIVYDILGDTLELHRLLTNLVGNAIKFTDKGSVQVHLKGASHQALLQGQPPEATWVRVEVHDTGVGIPLEEQESLFERFRQGNHKRMGSGLGLYLSRRIIEAHKGTITVQSEIGQGSVFVICLPGHLQST